MRMLNIASMVTCTESEGPGKRFALWVQGCLKGCPGCCNPHMLEIVHRDIVSCDEVFDQILQAKAAYNIEGVTFVGGEPMLQAKGLSVVARRCQEEELSIMLFTGYTRDELKELSLTGTDELIGCTDILVAGPYLQECPEKTRNWIGSRNQKIYFLTERYKPGIEHDFTYQSRVEIRISQHGRIRLNGEPTKVVSM